MSAGGQKELATANEDVPAIKSMQKALSGGLLLFREWTCDQGLSTDTNARGRLLDGVKATRTRFYRELWGTSVHHIIRDPTELGTVDAAQSKPVLRVTGTSVSWKPWLPLSPKNCQMYQTRGSLTKTHPRHWGIQK